MTGVVRLAVTLVLLLVAVAVPQTRVSEDQVRLRVRLVEWQRCQWTSDDGKVSCVGTEMYRFLMSDGSIRGPIFGIPVGPEYQHDPAKWVRVSE